MIRRFIATVVLGLLGGLLCDVQAYSVLAHEALIDAAWEQSIQPLLLKRFPNATPDELRQAHGFAYGGAIIQDLGYYPHGRHYFSDLVHYVRSGDFIMVMIGDSQNLDEYAFALGALAHYAADNDGHRIGVNPSVPLLYPKLRKKYPGRVVTYEDDPAAHLKTEFGFDVLEVAKGRYGSNAYRNFIGFDVAKGLLERGFEDTYSVPLRSLFTDLDRSIGSYRYDVHKLIPAATRVAWVLKKNEIQRDLPGVTRRKFLYNISQSSYEKEWGKDYEKPGIRSRLLAFVIRIMPKIGALRALSFRTPTPEAEKMFMASFNAALDEYRRLLAEVGAGRLHLPNSNFDTGGPLRPGSYFLADDAYASLLDDLAQARFQQLSPALRSNMLTYFAELTLPDHIKIRRDKMEKERVDWTKVPRELDELKSRSIAKLPESECDPVAADASESANSL